MNLEEKAENNEALRQVLEDIRRGHVETAAFVGASESAVRRYRKNHGIELKKDVPEAISDTNIESDDAEYLRKELIRVGKLYEKEKNSTSAYVKAVYSAVSDSINAWGTGMVPVSNKLYRNGSSGGEEVAVALVSDLQLAKVTKVDGKDSYNSVVAYTRMMEYADKIIEITNIQRVHHPVNKLVVPVLGDMIEGEEIFPGQMHLVDGGLYRQITVDGPRIFLAFIQKLLEHFDDIEIVWVIGNHGRIGGTSSKNHDPETNGDRMLGRICQMMLEHEKRVTFRVRDGIGESSWYDIVRIGNYSALCIHGNQIPGGNGLPFNGISRKVNAWAAGGITESFLDVFMGHYHTRAVVPVNKRNVYVNGSIESDNDYAREVVASVSDPGQWLLYVHPERGRVTATYGIDLT